MGPKSRRDNSNSWDVIFETRCTLTLLDLRWSEVTKCKLKYVMSVKQVSLREQTGEITCWERLSATQVELHGTTNQENNVQLGDCREGQDKPDGVRICQNWAHSLHLMMMIPPYMYRKFKCKKKMAYSCIHLKCHSEPSAPTLNSVPSELEAYTPNFHKLFLILRKKGVLSIHKFQMQSLHSSIDLMVIHYSTVMLQVEQLESCTSIPSRDRGFCLLHSILSLGLLTNGNENSFPGGTSAKMQS
jgi:hypothetical protein